MFTDGFIPCSHSESHNSTQNRNSINYSLAKETDSMGYKSNAEFFGKIKTKE